MHSLCWQRIIYNSQDMEATWVPTNRWTEEDAVHLYNGTLLSHKKDWKMPFAATWMDWEIIPGEESQTEKDKSMIFLCGISKNGDKWTYL